MRRSIMVLGLIGVAFTSTISGVAMAGTAPAPAPSASPPAAEAPESIVTTPAPSSGAPAISGVSLFGIVGYGNSVGVGARYQLPVGIPSLIHHHRIKDSWAVEFGADLIYWSVDYAFAPAYHETELRPVGGLMWNVWLTPQFAVYPKAEIGWGFNVAGSQYNYVGHSGIFPSGASGLLYRITDTITLRAELGFSGLRGGVGFFF